jgi:hypothetical protein
MLNVFNSCVILGCGKALSLPVNRMEREKQMAQNNDKVWTNWNKKLAKDYYDKCGHEESKNFLMVMMMITIYETSCKILRRNV